MQKELKSIVADYRIPGIMVTHDMREITGIGDRVCLLENGKIAIRGKADEFLAKRMIRAASLTILGPRAMATLGTFLTLPKTGLKKTDPHYQCP